MKLRRLMVVLLAMVAGTLTIQNSRANDTNAASAGTIEFEFINAPCHALALWQARLTGEPVLVPVNVDFQTTYRTKERLTREGALQWLAATFQTNGVSFVNVNHQYYRVVKGAAVDLPPDRPHIDVEVQDDGFLVNGSLVDRKELIQAIARAATPKTEIWVHGSIETAEMLRSSPKLDADNIYLECMPSFK